MKLDKETIIVVGICIIVLFGWDPFCRYVGLIPEKTEIKTVKKVEEKTQIEEKKDDTTEVDTAAAEKKAPEKKQELPLLKLENNKCIITFNADYSAVDKIIFKDFFNNSKTDKITVSNDYNLQKGILAFDFAELVSKEFIKSDVQQNRVVITERLTLKDKSKVVAVRTYELNENYTISYDISLKSDKNSVINKFFVSGGDLQRWSNLSGDKIRTDKLEITYMTSEDDDETLNSTVSDYKFTLSPAIIARWEALSNKFFTLILKADGDDNFTPTVSRKKLEGKDNYLVSFAGCYSDVKLDGGVEKNFKFKYYAGPKEPELLKEFDPDCNILIHLAWGPLNPLAKGLLWSLVKLKDICGSYGWSIIILTVIVRLIFWPVTQKSNESMKKMQKLQPQLKEIREKYKDNPQLLNSKTMELYQKEQVNPFSGCLPILLQIPVFFALYATLDNALELRQVAFWWASDLATADTVWSHPLGFSVFGISNIKLNPLVIVMTALMVVQQRITPSAMDPAQQKMMALMPVFMLIFLYDLPSGLTLYWTVSQIFSLLQVYLQRKFDKKKSAAA